MCTFWQSQVHVFTVTTWLSNIHVPVLLKFRNLMVIWEKQIFGTTFYPIKTTFTCNCNVGQRCPLIILTNSLETQLSIDTIVSSCSVCCNRSIRYSIESHISSNECEHSLSICNHIWPTIIWWKEHHQVFWITHWKTIISACTITNEKYWSANPWGVLFCTWVRV